MLAIYPVSPNTLINNQNRARKIKVAGGHGNYYIPSENVIRINGPAGFGIKSYDLLNNSYNRCGPYSIELIIDTLQIYHFRMDAFSFAETRYINSHIDYETYVREKTHYHRTYILPNDKLSLYQNSINRGLFDFNDGQIHNVEISITDMHNNRSVLRFKVISGDGVSYGSFSSGNSESIVMPYSRNNKYANRNVTVSIPAGALYDTLLFNYSRKTGSSDTYSDIHQIHNRFTPVHVAYSLSIKPERIPEGLESKMLIIQQSENNGKIPLTTRWEGGYVHARPNSFGSFYVGIDTVPPVINPVGLIPGINLTGRRDIRIRIGDNLSGIKSYEPLIDGKWVLFEYDQKNNLLIHRFDPRRIEKGNKHNLILTVTDNKDNISVYQCDFTW